VATVVREVAREKARISMGASSGSPPRAGSPASQGANSRCTRSRGSHSWSISKRCVRGKCAQERCNIEYENVKVNEAKCYLVPVAAWPFTSAKWQGEDKPPKAKAKAKRQPGGGRGRQEEVVYLPGIAAQPLTLQVQPVQAGPSSATRPMAASALASQQQPLPQLVQQHVAILSRSMVAGAAQMVASSRLRPPSSKQRGSGGGPPVGVARGHRGGSGLSSKTAWARRRSSSLVLPKWWV